MGGSRRSRTRGLAVLTAVVLASTLTSCGNTTVTGHGKLVAAHGSDPAAARALLRTPSTTPFGDPVTADLCAAVPAAQLMKFGSPSVHTFQSAGRCYYNLATSDSLFQLDTDLVTTADFRPAKGYTTSLLRGAVVYHFPHSGKTCRAALVVDGYVLDTASYVFDGTVPVRRQCAAVESLVAAEAAAYIGSKTPPRRRTMPQPTFTRFDQCELLDEASRVAVVSTFDDAYKLDEGGGCARSNPYGDDYISAQVVIISDDHETGGHTTTVGRRQMNVTASNDGCEALYGLGRIASAGSREYLDVIYTTTSPRLACLRATGTAAAMLDAAGQR